MCEFVKKSESGGQPESEGYIPRKEEIEGTIIIEPKKVYCCEEASRVTGGKCYSGM